MQIFYVAWEHENLKIISIKMARHLNWVAYRSLLGSLKFVFIALGIQRNGMILIQTSPVCISIFNIRNVYFKFYFHFLNTLSVSPMHESVHLCWIPYIDCV